MNEAEQIKSLLTELREAQDFAKHQENMRIVFETENCELRETVKLLTDTIRTSSGQIETFQASVDKRLRTANQLVLDHSRTATAKKFFHRIFSRNLPPEIVSEARSERKDFLT